MDAVEADARKVTERDRRVAGIAPKGSPVDGDVWRWERATAERRGAT
jgi:hypothetical protein